MASVAHMQELVDYVARILVDHPEEVEVVADPQARHRLDLQVAEDDLGQIIGRRGRTAKALRTLLRAAAGAELQISGGGVSSEEEAPAS